MLLLDQIWLSLFLTNSEHQPLKVPRQLILYAVFYWQLCNLLIFIKNCEKRKPNYTLPGNVNVFSSTTKMLNWRAAVPGQRVQVPHCSIALTHAEVRHTAVPQDHDEFRLVGSPLLFPGCKQVLIKWVQQLPLNVRCNMCSRCERKYQEFLSRQASR